jgi:hypothetical protein
MPVLDIARRKPRPIARSQHDGAEVKQSGSTMPKATAKKTAARRAVNKQTDDAKLISLNRKIAELYVKQRGASDDEHFRLWQEATAVYETMMQLKPSSPAGYRALAQAVLRRCPDILDREEWDDDADLTAGVRLVLSSLAA